MKRTFKVVVERDEEGWFVASVPELPGCHTQGKSLEEALERVREAILVWLDAEDDDGEAVGASR